MKKNHWLTIIKETPTHAISWALRFVKIARACFCLMVIIGFTTNIARAQENDLPKSAAAKPITSKSAKVTNEIGGHQLGQWVDRTPAISRSSLPGAGEDCGLIYDPRQHRMILFGGKNDNNASLNEVWALDLEQNKWQHLAVMGEAPPASEDHVTIYDPLSYRLVLHGGEKGKSTNKTWSFDLQSPGWRNMTDSTAPVREDHTAIFDSRSKRMVMYGGRDNSFVLFDIWGFDLDPNSPTFEKWQDLTVYDRYPRGRADHVAVFDSVKNRMLVYGGWDDDRNEYLNDTWAFYFAVSPDTAGRWQQIDTGDSYPPRRRHSVSVYDSARDWFIIFGGFGEEGFLNDVWAFDLNEDVWINITPGPQPRMDHQAIYDPRSRRMLIYGGDAHFEGKFHDIWELQIRPDLPLDQLLRGTGAKLKNSKKQ